MRKALINLQGMTFTEENAKEYYGNRINHTVLFWVEIDEDGDRTVLDQYVPA